MAASKPTFHGIVLKHCVDSTDGTHARFPTFKCGANMDIYISEAAYGPVPPLPLPISTTYNHKREGMPKTSDNYFYVNLAYYQHVTSPHI